MRFVDFAGILRDLLTRKEFTCVAVRFRGGEAFVRLPVSSGCVSGSKPFVLFSEADPDSLISDNSIAVILTPSVVSDYLTCEILFYGVVRVDTIQNFSHTDGRESVGLWHRHPTSALFFFFFFDRGGGGRDLEP